MITPEDIDAWLDENGESAVLRRASTADLPVKAKVLQLKSEDLVGDLKQTDRRVVIGNGRIVAAGWPGPPIKGDRIVLAEGPSTVLLPGTRRLGDVIIGHWMVVRGS